MNFGSTTFAQLPFGGNAVNGNASVVGVEAIGSVGTVTATGGGTFVAPNGGFGYPFIYEPDNIANKKPRIVKDGSALVRPVSARGKINTIYAHGEIIVNASANIQGIHNEMQLSYVNAEGIQNPTDEELFLLFMME
jgi:hypothetical protein